MNQKLIAAFQKGENWAFTEIYQRFLKPIQNYVSLRIPNEDIAQEVAQEIFLKAYRFSSSYRMSFAFTTWLWTIARNTVSDFMRRPEAEQIRNPHEQLEPDQLPAAGPGAEAIILIKSGRKLLFRISRKLTANQRRALWMRTVGQLSYREISVRLDTSISAAKCLVHRAKQQLAGAGVSGTLGELLASPL